MNYIIKNDLYTATITDAGAELISLKTADGKELIWNSKSDKHWSKHAPLLFPVCGRLKDSKYSYDGVTYDLGTHGFAMKRTFSVVKACESEIVMQITSDSETRKIYPFDFTLSAIYALTDKGLTFSAVVENKSDVPLPYMFGWHPGFTLFTDGGQDIEDYCLEFSNVEELEWIPLQNVVFASPVSKPYPIKNSKLQIVEKEIYENDTLIFKGHNNALKLYAKNHPYTLSMSWSDNMPFLCIWKDPDNAAKYICLEPWSGVPNDGFADENFNTRKMERLAPGKKEEYSYSLEFSF